KTFIYNQMNTFWRGPEPQVLHPHPMMRPMPGMAMKGMNPFLPLMDTTMQNTTSEKTWDRANKAWFEAQWQENTLDVLILSHFQEPPHFWILAETEDTARAFLAAVSRWSMEIHDEILVFDNGGWYKNEHLSQDIKNATFDNLILRDTLKQDILD